MADSRGPGSRSRRWWLVGLAALPVLAAAAVFGARHTLSLAAPHRRSRPSAMLSRELQANVDEQIRHARVTSVADAMALALTITGSQLSFGLDHQTSLSFDRPRAGNCVEYSHFFATVFERIAAHFSLTTKAQVVRSYDARIFGLRLPFRSWRDHDWVLIDESPSGPRRYVDPAFADALLGWGLAPNVKGLE
jgi:hypothetical protein